MCEIEGPFVSVYNIQYIALDSLVRSREASLSVRSTAAAQLLEDQEQQLVGQQRQDARRLAGTYQGHDEDGLLGPAGRSFDVVDLPLKVWHARRRRVSIQSMMMMMAIEMRRIVPRSWISCRTSGERASCSGVWPAHCIARQSALERVGVTTAWRTLVALLSAP